MAIKTATPYLFFDGNAEEALGFYERALDARVEGLMRYEQLPEESGACAPEDEKRIMHALVHVGQARLMVSDTVSERQRSPGSNVDIVLDFDDAEEMAQRFDALAASGNVVMAIHDAFWGDKFGALQDRYGINWMFICSAAGGSSASA